MAKHNFRGEFKAQTHITTTLPVEIQRLAWEKAIPWSRALTFGVKYLAYHEVGSYDYREKEISTTERNKTARLQKAVVQMQETIDELQGGDKNVLEKE
tara:strand:+ start:53 stop:346 length:294 start_codon:yes stop_codon:yes gene_type:complete